MATLVERLRTGFDWDESSSNVKSLIQYGDITDDAADRIEELEAKLAKYEQQEPVAWLNEANQTMRHGTASVCFKNFPEFGYTIPLYTNKIGDTDD